MPSACNLPLAGMVLDAPDSQVPIVATSPRCPAGEALLALKSAVATNGWGQSKLRTWKPKGMWPNDADGTALGSTCTTPCACR